MVSSSSSFAPVRGSDDHAEASDGIIELSNHLATTVTTEDGDGNSSVLVATPEVSHNADDDLSMLQAAALLTADCLGTGLLALPQDILVLGKALGFGFLIFNLPVNWYVGALLSRAASHVEDTLLEEETQPSRTGDPASAAAAEQAKDDGRDGLLRERKRKTRNSTYSSVQQQTAEDGIGSNADSTTRSSQHVLDNSSPDDDSINNDDSNGIVATTTTAQDPAAAAIADDEDDDSHNHHKARHHLPDEQADDDTTHDYIGLTKLVFPHPHATQYQPRVTHLVIAVFYTNIFLVLGDYILVMSHAVAAMIGEGSICLPTAGIVASTLMFGFSQLRTMANLGRSVTVLSLSSLAIVVIQCLVAGERQEASASYVPPFSSENDDTSTIRKLSALASIGFATGPNKLLLNIRNEMKNRDESPSSLGVSMTTFGSVYVAICLLAGPNPPSFLFDAIPPGPSRRIAGLLLWIHVSVSYAINSQAICSSIDRLFLHRIQRFHLHQHPRRRWFLMTLVLIISSYLVANAVPFFKDLLALIGALTSVPLSLSLPIILHRRVWNMPIWWPTRHSLASYCILVFSVVFLAMGLVGTLFSIETDWANQGAPFECSA